MDINKKLAKKYNLNAEHFWKHKQGGNWIISHDAVMIIARTEGIVFHEPQIFIENHQSVAFLGSATLEGNHSETTWTTGEASPQNCFNKHIFAMAEKRLKDRLTLTLIGACQEGVYSDSEADDFSKNHKTQEEKFVDRVEKKNGVKKMSPAQAKLIKELIKNADNADKESAEEVFNSALSMKEASNLITELRGG